MDQVRCYWHGAGMGLKKGQDQVSAWHALMQAQHTERHARCRHAKNGGVRNGSILGIIGNKVEQSTDSKVEVDKGRCVGVYGWFLPLLSNRDTHVYLF